MNKRNPFFWILLVVGSLILFLAFAVSMVVFHYGRFTQDLGWKADIRNKAFYVSEIEPTGNAAGKLLEGDRILLLNGKPPRRSMGLRGSEKINMAPGQSYSLRISRNNQEQEISLSAGVVESGKNLVCVISLLAASFISFFVAMLIGLSKPDERATQLASVMGLSVGFIQLIATLEPMESFFGIREMQLGYLIWLVSLSPLSVAFAFDFFHRFPTDLQSKSGWRHLRKLIYVWSGILFGYFTIIRAILLFNLPKGIEYAMDQAQRFALDLDLLLNPLMLIALPATCAAIAWNYKRVKDPQDRHRIRWIMYGSVLGIAPTILYFILQSIRRTGTETWITHSNLSELFLATNLCLTLVPLAIGYAIIKHNVFGINVVVRLGFQYIFAKRVLQVLIYLPPIILAASIYANRDRPPLEVVFSNTGYVLLTVFALIGLKFRNSFLEKVDRKFFREAYVSEKILMQLIEDVGKMDSISDISKSISLQIENALHPKRILVFYRMGEKNELVLGHSSGDHKANISIPMHSQFLRVAENESSAQALSFFKRDDVPEGEREWMESMGVDLVVPVVGSNQRLIGLLLLGEKRSEEVYTPQDKKMLKAVATQIGVVYENALLKGKVDRGIKVQQEVLSHLQSTNRNLLKECPSCGFCYDSNIEVCPRDHTELALTLPVDRTIDEKYRLERLLGRGGMGAVYEATDLRLQRKVAVKILVGHMFGDHMALSRFEREARASAKLNHPNVVTIYDFGGIEGKGAFLVMEMLQGSTLRSILKDRGNLHPRTTANYFDQILKGVRASHHSGIIHRDLKPENIFISNNDEGELILKILDLGLAKIKQIDQPEAKSLTEPGTVLGTLNYMSPEQIAGSEVDERTDFFSLGVMVMEAMTGRQPFSGKTVSEVAIQILQKQVSLAGDSAEIAKLNSALQKCLAKNRTQRYSSAVELQEELIPAIAQCPPLQLESGSVSLSETIPN